MGIAEAAHDGVLESLASRGGGAESPHTQMLAAENAIELSAVRAVFDRAGALLDEHHLRSAGAAIADEEVASLFAEVQSAKTFVNEAAVRVVNRALALSGGAGYAEPAPALAGVPRRSRRSLHAPPGGQPSLRVHRAHRPRRRG